MEEQLERLKTLIETSDDEVMYLLLGSLVSSDNLNCVEDCNKSLDFFKVLKVAVTHANIDEGKRGKFLEYIERGIGIVTLDLSHFTNQQKQ